MAEGDAWTFSCPQFVDFSAVNELEPDDDVDKWFDFDHENTGLGGKTVISTPEPGNKRATRLSKTKTPVAENGIVQPEAEVTPQPVSACTRSKTPKADSIAGAGSKSLHTEATPGTQPIKAEHPRTDPAKKAGGASNICSDLEAWKQRTTVKQEVKSTDGGTRNKMDDKPIERTAIKRQHRSLERSESVSKKPKPSVPVRQNVRTSSLQRSATFSAKGSNSAAARSKHQRGLSGERAPQRTLRARVVSDPAEADKSHHIQTSKPTHLTVPVTPTVMKEKAIKAAPVKSSEELEMERIKFYRQELMKKRKLAQDSCKQALTAKGPAPVLHSREPTRPHGFQFETDSRIKPHESETRHGADVKDFKRMLRSNSPAPAASKGHVGPTVPKPFHLGGTTKKHKLSDLDEKQAEKYQTMAQKLAAFQATPERFKSKPKVGSAQKRGRSRSPPGMTVPRTPNFETRSRSRPVTMPTREELENLEVEDMKKHQFKANPVNTKALADGRNGVKEVPKRPVTVPEGFHLSSDRRVPDRGHESSEEEYKFHAQPLDKRILEGVVGVQPIKQFPPTIPESPAFALKHRARLPASDTSQQEEKRTRRSRAVPHFGVPFQPQLKPKTTELEPFTFDERDKIRAKNKELKIEQELVKEQQAREFHATPIPDLDYCNLPMKKKQPLTVQQPFNLESNQRGSKRAEEWKHKMEEELQKQKEMAKFRARSPHVLEQEPFVPKKDHKFTADISEFELSTAKRAVQREEFEILKKEKQDELDSIRVQEERMRKEAERAEHERLRQEAVHRANPIRRYKQLPVTVHDKPLTAPMTPNFRTDIRLNRRAQQSSKAS